MNAVREHIDFRPFMSENSTLHVRIDAELKRRLEAFAEEVHFDLDDLVAQMIEEMLFRNSPEFADPTHPRTIQYRSVERGLLQALRGETVPQEEVEKLLDRVLDEAADQRSPRKS
jgi:predicted transcriptional regulator